MHTHSNTHTLNELVCHGNDLFVCLLAPLLSALTTNQDQMCQMATVMQRGSLTRPTTTRRNNTVVRTRVTRAPNRSRRWWWRMGWNSTRTTTALAPDEASIATWPIRSITTTTTSKLPSLVWCWLSLFGPIFDFLVFTLANHIFEPFSNCNLEGWTPQFYYHSLMNVPSLVVCVCVCH